MSPKASDLAARMAASAAGARREAEPTPVPQRELVAPAQADIVKLTVKMTRAQHRFIRRFSFDTEVDASTIVRTLFTKIETDPVFAEEVRSLLQEQG